MLPVFFLGFRHAKAFLCQRGERLSDDATNATAACPQSNDRLTSVLVLVVQFAGIGMFRSDDDDRDAQEQHIEHGPYDCHRWCDQLGIQWLSLQYGHPEAVNVDCKTSVHSLLAKVPFPLTYRFKPMLQRGVELATLDASWLSSVSWYAVNIFGQRGINNLLLGENNAADQTRMMQDQMNMAAVSMPQDPSKAFKAEREGLLLVDHQWAFKTIENDIMSQRLHSRAPVFLK